MSEREPQRILYRLCRRMLWIYLKLFHRFRIIGVGHVPASGGCIIAANHVSFLDPPVVGAGTGHRMVQFMARDTLFSTRLAKWFMTNVGAVPISRERGDVGALRKCIQVLKDGGCLGLFPEGTRSQDGRLHEAKGGIGFLIAKAGVPVVPTYVQGTFKAYPRGAKWIRLARIELRFGPPVSVEEIAKLGSGRESYEQIGRLVMGRIDDLVPAHQQVEWKQPLAPSSS